MPAENIGPQILSSFLNGAIRTSLTTYSERYVDVTGLLYDLTLYRQALSDTTNHTAPGYPFYEYVCKELIDHYYSRLAKLNYELEEVEMATRPIE